MLNKLFSTSFVVSSMWTKNIKLKTTKMLWRTNISVDQKLIRDTDAKVVVKFFDGNAPFGQANNTIILNVMTDYVLLTDGFKESFYNANFYNHPRNIFRLF